LAPLKQEAKEGNTNMSLMIEMAHGFDAQGMIPQGLSCDPPPLRRTSLHDIQIRAYRIHQKHGGVYGGYTLDEWLEAEHELDEEHRGKRNKKEQLH
jgi:hypothetical protein